MSFRDRLIEIASAEHVFADEPMSEHTTFKAGGKADHYVEATSEDVLSSLLYFLNSEKHPFYVVGNGSNLLVADEGYRGVIITPAGEFCQVKADNTRIFAGAGCLLSKVASTAAENSLTGLEFASGIPGSVGGAIVMNAGAYGGEMSQVIDSVRAMDMSGKIIEFKPDELELGYRTSIFKKKKLVALSAGFILKKGDENSIREKMKDLNAQRRAKQPLEYPSAGSTFKRPAGNFAGKLIMEAGLAGFCSGGACVSEKHCGFIINKSDATATDIKTLMDEVIIRVKENSGITLEPEVCLLGF